jgi:hypothetical protein
MIDTSICVICGGGDANECACFCPNGPTYREEIYYREENARWSGDDTLAISCIEYRVVRRTPKGRWITPTWNSDDTRFQKFVLDGLGKRYAYPTRELARESFTIRKEREIMRCKAQHDRAVRYLALARTGKFGTRTEALHEIHTHEILLPEFLKAAN